MPFSLEQWALPWSSERCQTGPKARGWSRRKVADASPFHITLKSPERKEMAVCVSKRRDRREKIDVSEFLTWEGNMNFKECTST